MGWRETFRKMEADSRRTERKSLQIVRRAATSHGENDGNAAVYFFENQIQRLVTVHHDCGKRWNWLEIANKPPPEPPSRDNREQSLVESELDELSFTPTEPVRLHSREQAALAELENYSRLRKSDAITNVSEVENPEWVAILQSPPPQMPTRNSNQQATIESKFAACVEPKPPERADLRTLEAQVRLDSFCPGMLEKVLGMAERKRRSLTQDLETAREQDESEYQTQYRAYLEQFESWRQNYEALGQALEAARAEDETNYQSALKSYLRSKQEWSDRHCLAERIVAVNNARLQDNQDFHDACLRYKDELAGWEGQRKLLLRKLAQAKLNDELSYQQACEAHRQATIEWEELCELARRIVAEDIQTYHEVLEATGAFSEITELGTAVTFRPHTARLIEAKLVLNLDRLIPREMKAYTPTGRPMTKPMPKIRYWQLVSDHVCSCLLRIAREVFALFPADIALATAIDAQLDTSTGHQVEAPIISVALRRESLESLNFVSLDPSEALATFNHRMDFKKTIGFAPVSELTWDDILASCRPSGTKAEEFAEKAEHSVSLLKRLLVEQPSENGCHWISAGTVASMASVSQETKLTISVCRRVAEAIEEAGYCIEPDTRYGNGSYDWNQVIGVFKPAEGEPIAPTPAYSGAANLLKLCVLVAAADGTVDRHELGVFRQVIESQLHFRQTELKRLAVLERFLAANTEVVSKTPSKVAKAIPADKRLLIGQVLVKVAAVDHVITKSEYRVLERIFKAFELPSQTLTDLMQQVCPVPDEVTIQEAKGGSSGEAIPPREAQEKSPGFSLDMSKVYAITNETKEVVGILSVVMDCEPEDAPPSRRDSSSAPPPISRPTEPFRDGEPSSLVKFRGLDPTFHPVLQRLLARDSWPRSEFHALAGEFHLMPLSIHDVINEWADESLGDFLLEGEDPILIRRELILKEKA